MSRIFVSYKRKDKDKVFQIVHDIEEQLGEKCWVDLDGIETSRQFASIICKAIDNCEVLLFMHSSSHVDIDFEEDWTIRELNYAHAKKKRVVLIKIDDTPLDNIFLLLYGTSNNISINDETQKEKLLKDLRHWLPKPVVEEKVETIPQDNGKLEKPATTNTQSKKQKKQPKAPAEKKTESSKQETPPSNEAVCKDLLERGEALLNEDDRAGAKKCYEQAAELGSSKAQVRLGDCFMNAIGTYKSYKKAFSLYSSAAEQGDSEAIGRLGFCYEFGRGVDKDFKKAYEFYKQGAEAGDAESQFCLGDALSNGRGIRKNNPSAFKWFRKAADQGHADAQLCVADCYSKGVGVKQDLIEAFNYYKKSAEQGIAEAESKLADCYHYGLGTKMNEKRADELYVSAAKEGYADAQYHSGISCFYKGNYSLSKFWLKSAKDQGHTGAKDFLKEHRLKFMFVK